MQACQAEAAVGCCSRAPGMQVRVRGCCSSTCMRMLFLALGLRFCLPGPWFCRSCSCWYHVLALSVPMRPRPYSSLHSRQR